MAFSGAEHAVQHRKKLKNILKKQIFNMQSFPTSKATSPVPKIKRNRKGENNNSRIIEERKEESQVLQSTSQP